MTEHTRLLTMTLLPALDTDLGDLGFVGRGRRAGRAWTRGDLQVRVVPDSKATDPFAGGAFTLEVERSTDGRFGRRLAGRVRLHQLLDGRQRSEALTLRNLVAERLPRPDVGHLDGLPATVQATYWKAFEPADSLEARFWMRYHGAEDLELWTRALGDWLPSVVERASVLDPHALLLGEDLAW